jgi:hypothetical protein
MPFIMYNDVNYERFLDRRIPRLLLTGSPDIPIRGNGNRYTGFTGKISQRGPGLRRKSQEPPQQQSARRAEQRASRTSDPRHIPKRRACPPAIAHHCPVASPQAPPPWSATSSARVLNGRQPRSPARALSLRASRPLAGSRGVGGWVGRGTRSACMID